MEAIGKKYAVRACAYRARLRIPCAVRRAPGGAGQRRSCAGRGASVGIAPCKSHTPGADGARRVALLRSTCTCICTFTRSKPGQPNPNYRTRAVHRKRWRVLFGAGCDDVSRGPGARTQSTVKTSFVTESCSLPHASSAAALPDTGRTRCNLSTCTWSTARRRTATLRTGRACYTRTCPCQKLSGASTPLPQTPPW